MVDIVRSPRQIRSPEGLETPFHFHYDTINVLPPIRDAFQENHLRSR
jgi:hypothetical protein